MPYNGVGTFTSLGPPTFPAVSNTYILASYFNATINDIFTGLTTAMTRDGQAAMTADLQMGSKKITGLLDGAAASDAVTYSQVFVSPVIANPSFTGIPTAPTAVGGTNTTQIATTEFVIAQAMNVQLPLQAGNAGKILSTDGSTASWAAASSPGSDIFLATNFGAI